MHHRPHVRHRPPNQRTENPEHPWAVYCPQCELGAVLPIYTAATHTDALRIAHHHTT